ncbi:MAG: hypothetical protein HYV59_14050 [Planctomycetes bacterium]|nr:hypothetical protein [Planctomycetota bacterium]
MAVITIPKVLREKLTDEGADALVEIINKSEEKSKEDIIVLVEEKFERRLLKKLVKSGLGLLNGCLFLSLVNSGQLLVLFLFSFKNNFNALFTFM